MLRYLLLIFEPDAFHKSRNYILSLVQTRDERKVRENQNSASNYVQFLHSILLLVDVVRYV